jgi:tetratricopeptide (TPR) repeat protein
MSWLVPLCLTLLVVAGAGAPVQSQAPRGRPLARTARDRSFDAISDRARETRESGRPQEALPHYRAALRLRPKWEEGWWYLGTLHYDLAHYAEAREAFVRYVALRPEGGAAWAFMALCEYQLKDYELALQHVQRALRQGLGTNEDLQRVTRYHAALLLARSADFQHANENLDKLGQAGEPDANVIEAFGIVLLRLRLLPHEIAAGQRELVLLAGRAASAHASGRVQEARLRYAELLARYPNTPNVHYAYGVLLMGGDADRALEQFRRELELSPDHVDARLQIAYEALKRGDYDTGLPLAEEAVRRAPDLFAARNALGRLLLGKGEVERAVRELERGVALEPGSPPLHFALAQAYRRAGRTEEGERELALFRRLEDIRREIETAEGQVRLLPTDPQRRRELAAAYERAGRRTDAQAELGVALQLEHAPRLAPFEKPQ